MKAARSMAVLAACCFFTVAAWAGPEVEERLMGVVDTLTAPELAGRGAGSPEASATADSLATWLARLGFAPAFAGEYFQTVDLDGEGWSGQPLAGRSDRNVAGVLPGRGDLADRWLVLGAHHDHLGRVDPAVAGVPASDAYYPGANDNASGVTVLLEMAREIVSLVPESGRSVLVIFFAAEEVGLQGSARFVADPPVPLEAVDTMINLDTVGRTHDGKLFVSGVGTSPPLRALVEDAAVPGLTLELADGGWSGSDHMNFNTREVPVLFLFGGPYPEYNRPTDTRAILDPPAMARVVAYGSGLVARLRVADADFPWLMVEAAGLRENDGTGAGNRATWLGTLPDFAGEIDGYTLAGVFDDSPAALAGLQKGDVLVGFGGRTVTDLASFTRALRANDPGALVELEVLRAEQALRFTVVLGDRADRR